MTEADPPAAMSAWPLTSALTMAGSPLRKMRSPILMPAFAQKFCESAAYTHQSPRVVPYNAMLTVFRLSVFVCASDDTAVLAASRHPSRAVTTFFFTDESLQERCGQTISPTSG